MAVAPNTAYPDLYAPLSDKTAKKTQIELELHREETKEGVRFPESHARCRRPLNEWNAKGAARIVLAAILTDSGRAWTVSTMLAVLNVEGAIRYAREKP